MTRTEILDLETLIHHEIRRCTNRIAECNASDANSDPKARAAHDRDRDRAFVSLRRAVSMLRLIPTVTPDTTDAPAQQGIHLVPKPQPEGDPNPAPAIARNAPCPCNSGDKYKRCCGRQAPPMPLRTSNRLPLAA